MASSPLLMRLLSASVTLSHRAGIIIRDILKTGDLGIHDKVRNRFLLFIKITVKKIIVLF